MNMREMEEDGWCSRNRCHDETARGNIYIYIYIAAVFPSNASNMRKYVPKRDKINSTKRELIEH